MHQGKEVCKLPLGSCWSKTKVGEVYNLLLFQQPETFSEFEDYEVNY